MWKQIQASYTNFNKKWPTLPLIYKMAFVMVVMGIAALIFRAF